MTKSADKYIIFGLLNMIGKAGRERTEMNFKMKEQGSGFAVSRLCGILLSLSFFAVCLSLTFSADRIAEYDAQTKYEKEVAAVLENNIENVANGFSKLYKKEEALKNSKKKNPAPSPLHIGVGKNFKVNVVADGKKRSFSVNSGTVSDLLSEAGVKVNEYDLLNFKTDDALKPGMTVRLRRVTFKLETRTVSVEYKTKKKKTKDLYLGEMYLEREGENGERKDIYIKTYIDGEFKKDFLASSEVTKRAVDEVIFVGTKKRLVKIDDVGTVGYSGLRAVSELPSTVKIELDEYGKPVKYKRKIVGSATAYYGGGITATGQKAMPGRVAVDPREIPYGSKLYVVSCDGTCVYGYCEASDTGGFIYNSETVIDLYFNTFAECSNFGRRNVEIYVLE